MTAVGEVFDLDAAKAAQREAAGEPFTFAYAGDKYQIPLSADWPVEVSEMLANENGMGAMRMLLSLVDGYEAADRFMAQRPTVGHVKLLFDAAAKHEGLDVPNLSEPPRPGSSPT